MTPETVPEKIDAFSFVRALMEDGKDLVEARPDLAGEYRKARWLITRALSFYPDTILTAQAANERPFMSDLAHRKFFLSMISAKRRGRRKWGKLDRDERLPILMRYYECSERDAQAVVDLHTDDQFTQMDEMFEAGGIRSR